ncbi:hypothetical protein GQM55_23080, partial [Escherichia coli]|nr:hypothetical protein [Escherichia coli]
MRGAGFRNLALVRYGYNSQRQVTSVTYPDGLRSSREYDERGRLTAETSRSGETT